MIVLLLTDAVINSWVINDKALIGHVPAHCCLGLAAKSTCYFLILILSRVLSTADFQRPKIILIDLYLLNTFLNFVQL